MNFEEAQNWLYGLGKTAFGGPKAFLPNFPVIHVAGTNGKGSVSALLESIYRQAGYKVGLYTSPHLVDIRERIQINRELISKEDFVRYVELFQTEFSENKANSLNVKEFRDRPYSRSDKFWKEFITARRSPFRKGFGETHFGGPKWVSPTSIPIPTFFECMTAIGFLYFSEKEVDIGIIEVGLGGRLDPTNVVDPEVSIITSIGLDHMEILGDSFEKIAAEKGGIIKQQRPVVIGKMPQGAEEVIRNIAKTKSAPVFSTQEAFGSDIEKYPQSALSGQYQRQNAATAVLATKVLQPRFPITEEQIQRGLATVKWQGRWEKVPLSDNKLLILDCSHNEEGASTLAQNLTDLSSERFGEKPIMVIGTLGERRAKAILSVAQQFAKQIVLTEPHDPKATPTSVMKQMLLDLNYPLNNLTCTELDHAFKKHSTPLGSPNDVIVATGSIYLIGNIIELVEG